MFVSQYEADKETRNEISAGPSSCNLFCRARPGLASLTSLINFEARLNNRQLTTTAEQSEAIIQMWRLPRFNSLLENEPEPDSVSTDANQQLNQHLLPWS